jgi:hypothetical protein
VKKPAWASAGTSATLGALMFVSVDQGKVRLSRGDEELVLTAGQSGSIGSDGIPRSSPPAPLPSAAAPSGEASPAAARQEPRRMSPDDSVERGAIGQGHFLCNVRSQGSSLLGDPHCGAGK